MTNPHIVLQLLSLGLKLATLALKSDLKSVKLQIVLPGPDTIIAIIELCLAKWPFKMISLISMVSLISMETSLVE